MRLINYIKRKLFSRANDEHQSQLNVSHVAESSQKETAVSQEPAPQYADSSGIPDDERRYYREDEYYTLRTWNDEPVITFEERKKTCIPSAGGLYVAEILLLEYCNKNRYPPSIKSGYPGFWWFQYGLRNVGGALRSLENRGFIEINKDSGKYALTQIGKQELEENEYVPYMHRNNLHHIDVWGLNLLLNEKNKENWRTVIGETFDCQNRKRIPIVINGVSCELELPYVSLSTSGDERVCKMCKQFEGKLFRVEDAPQLPLHPMCGCAYQSFETPGRKKIWNPADFVWPAECTLRFCANADAIVRERSIQHRIQLCAEGLAMLKDFLAPYREAKWSPPEELPCVYWSIHDYMALGDWKNAERAVQVCIDAGAFTTVEGKEQLNKVRLTSEASSAALQYLTENPGTLQRNIYRKLCPPCDREALKWFLAHSLQIRKDKAEKTNKLFVVGEKETQGEEPQFGGGANA